MESEPFIKPSFINLVRWLFAVVVIFVIGTMVFYERQGIAEASGEPSIICRVKIALSPNKDKERMYHQYVVEAADEYRIDPALVKAIIMAESGYDPKAVSKKGAQGLMQLMPRTARALGVVDTFNPQHNIDGGVKYFRSLLNQFGNDVKLALAAYNAGSTKVKKYNGIPPIRATRHYINKVFDYYLYYKKEMNKDENVDSV
jgi:soluble lytic murein transglycosylase-like protein